MATVDIAPAFDSFPTFKPAYDPAYDPAYIDPAEPCDATGESSIDKSLTLALPVGHLGVYFSSTTPCEICRVEEESPIFERTLQFIGRIAYHLSIPGRIDVYGAIDNATLQSILAAYSNIPNRKLMFKNRSDVYDQQLITTTVLPTGPIGATFRSSRRFFPSRNRVYVEGSNANFEYPVGHFVQKVIIPNRVVLEGGVRTSERLIETLNHFSKVPGRKIVFQKNLPRGESTTSVTLPKGPTGLLFYTHYEDLANLPIVSTVLVESAAWKLNVPVDHVVEKLIIPNEIAIERMNVKVVEKVLQDYQNIDGRIVVLRENRKDIPHSGSKVTMTLPTGRLNVVFKSIRSSIWLADVKEGSSIRRKCPVGFYVESLMIPGELELVGGEELMNATNLSSRLTAFSNVPNRVMVFKQFKRDVRSREGGIKYDHELV